MVQIFQTENLNIKSLVAHPGLAITELQNTTVKDGDEISIIPAIAGGAI